MNRQSDKTKIIAFYLPQFHPIKENDEWWGKGFTEWTNVSKAKPLYPGHVQPKLPSELGFYDLRLPDVAKQQAALAEEYGIYGFCYYFYWFGPNKQLLERPLNEMLASGSPDFPFCLCWANENWTRRWDGAEQEILMKQEYSDDVASEFINALLPSFRDKRYIRIGNKPLLLVYDVRQLPQINRSIALWRKYVKESGFDDLYIVRCNTFVEFGKEDDPIEQGFDACMDFPPHGFSSAELPNISKRADLSTQAEMFDYKSAIATSLVRQTPPYKLFRGVMSGWDNTPRKPLNPRIFLGSTPPLYEFWLRSMIDWTAAQHKPEEQLVFVFAWNEWAEGAALEPDIHTGRQYLEATRNAIRPGSQCSFSKLLRHDVTMHPASYCFQDGTVVRDGNRLEKTESIKGRIDKLEVSDTPILIEGWAADTTEEQGDLQILVFDGELLIGTTNTRASCADHAGELGIKALRCGFKLQLNESLESTHLRICALNSSLGWRQLHLQAQSMEKEELEEHRTQSDYFSRCQAELIALVHSINYSGRQTVLLVGQNSEKNGITPHKIDLLLNNAHASFGKNTNVLFLEFTDPHFEFVTLSTLTAPEIKLHFELPRHQHLLLQILQSLQLDYLEILDKSRLEAPVTEITNTLLRTIDRLKANTSIQNALNLYSAPTVQQSSMSRVTIDAGEIETHEKVENPIVSVCLPVRNAEKSIAATLKSILDQNIRSIEVLVIDDCSEDNTFEILRAFAERDKRLIPWQNGTQIGKTACFNECLMRASGRYIKPLEQTAILSQGALSILVRNLDENPEYVLVASLPGDSIATSHQEANKDFRRITLEELLRSGIFSFKEQIGTCSQLMFRAESIGSGFNSSLNHFAELDYWLRILSKGDLHILPFRLSRTDKQQSDWLAGNKFYIEISSELLDLKRIWKSNLEQMNLDVEALFDQAILLIASKLAAYEHKQGNNALTRLDPEIFNQAKLQDITLNVMRTLGRSQYSDIARNRKIIVALENQLCTLLNTYSWKITRPMRELKAIVRSSGSSRGLMSKDIADVSQEEYAHYLRDVIKKVKTSRSWKLTAALRRYKRVGKKTSKFQSLNNV
jgi:glycosyltransferase involved in cell wall biosynthesis